MARTRRLIPWSLIVTALLVPSCAGATPSAPARSGMHGLDAGLSTDALAERVDLVVRARVTDRSVVPIGDDPFLPRTEQDALQSEAARSGRVNVKWRADIEAWERGSSSASIFIVRGIDVTTKDEGEESLRRSADDPASPDLRYESEFGLIQPDAVYRFLLSRDTWFEQDHWILEAAEPL